MPRRMTEPHLRRATGADRPRIHEVRHGTAENRLLDPSLVTEGEVAWYMDFGIFLVSEDAAGVRGFTCVNPLTGYVWALFVIDEMQGRGHGTRLLDAAMQRLREAGHRQAFLSTGEGTKAEGFLSVEGLAKDGHQREGRGRVSALAMTRLVRHIDPGEWRFKTRASALSVFRVTT